MKKNKKQKISNKNQQEKYDSIGNIFDFVSGIFERRIINFGVDLLSLKKKESFLDLACGTGKVLLYASKKTNMLFGCDFSKSMLHVAKKRLKNTNVKLELSDITKKIPYPNSFFDKINFSVTLGMIDAKKHKKMFSEIKRVLKNDGILVVTEYTTKKRNLFTNILEWENRVWPKFQDCKPVNVEQILLDNGFCILKINIKNCFGFKFEIVLAKKK